MLLLVLALALLWSSCHIRLLWCFRPLVGEEAVQQRTFFKLRTADIFQQAKT